MNRKRSQRKKKNERYIEPLSNYDIIDLAKTLKIPHFHGVFMRDKLFKKNGPATQECWILNHANSNWKDGTHWTALAKANDTAVYFDSFGKLPPPLEVVSYLGGDNIKLYYNAKPYQKYGSTICGHLCLKFLHDFWQNRKYKTTSFARKCIT